MAHDNNDPRIDEGQLHDSEQSSTPFFTSDDSQWHIPHLDSVNLGHNQSELSTDDGFNADGISSLSMLAMSPNLLTQTAATATESENNPTRVMDAAVTEDNFAQLPTPESTQSDTLDETSLKSTAESSYAKNVSTFEDPNLEHDTTKADDDSLFDELSMLSDDDPMPETDCHHYHSRHAGEDSTHTAHLDITQTTVYSPTISTTNASASTRSLAQPFPIAVENPSPDDSAKSESNRDTRRFLIIGIIGVIIVGIIVTLTILWRNRNHELNHSELLKACTTSRSSAAYSSEQLQKTINKVHDLATTSADSVTSTSSLKKLTNSVEIAKSSIANEKAIEQCNTGMSDIRLKNLREEANRVVTLQDGYAKDINESSKAVEKSKEEKAVTSVRESLTAKRQEAQLLYDNSKDKVADEKVRQTLSKMITEADSLISMNIKSVSTEQYANAKKNLENAIAAVNSSMQAKSEADKKAEEESNRNGLCAPFAGTYSGPQGSFTLSGSCKVSAGKKHVSVPSNGNAYRLPNGSYEWQSVCDKDSQTCIATKITLYPQNVTDTSGGRPDKPRVSVNGSLYTLQ